MRRAGAQAGPAVRAFASPGRQAEVDNRQLAPARRGEQVSVLADKPGAAAEGQLQIGGVVGREFVGRCNAPNIPPASPGGFAVDLDVQGVYQRQELRNPILRDPPVSLPERRVLYTSEAAVDRGGHALFNEPLEDRVRSVGTLILETPGQDRGSVDHEHYLRP